MIFHFEVPMIVSEKNVSDALAYLAIDPHPVALARKDLTDSENAREERFAVLYRFQNQGSIKDRECAVEIDTTYQDLKAAEAAAEFELERHKARIRAAEMLIEVWRSENANARVAERVR